MTMQFQHAILVALLSLFHCIQFAKGEGGVECEYVDQIPTCAIPCLKSAALTISCPTSDYNCVCNAARADPAIDVRFRDHARPCVLKDCGFMLARETQELVGKMCEVCVWGEGEGEEKDEL